MNTLAIPRIRPVTDRIEASLSGLVQRRPQAPAPGVGRPRPGVGRWPGGPNGLCLQTWMSEGAALDSHVYAPAGTRQSLGTLISVHGVTRRAQEQFARWLPFAERLQLTLVAPCFGRDRFPGYQRLAGRKGGLPADSALLRLLDHLRNEGVVGGGPVFLFGYSGGAQFVHRFLLAHPDAADGAAVASAGWYTFPDRVTPFPYGLATARVPLASRLDAFLQKPVLVAVGEDDIQRDRQLRRRLWMDAWQGRTRVERAERWAEALRGEARRRGLGSRVSLCHLPGAGHSFTECMRAGLGWQVAMFLADLLPLVGGGRADA